MSTDDQIGRPGPPAWLSQSGGFEWCPLDVAIGPALPDGTGSHWMTDAMWTAITGSPRPAPSLELANWDGGNAIYRLFPPIDAAAAPPAAVGQRPIAVDFKDGHSGLVLTPA